MCHSSTSACSFRSAPTFFKPLIDHFSAMEYATKYATKQESRLEFTTRTGVEDTDGSAETVRSACPRASLQARG